MACTESPSAWTILISFGPSGTVQIVWSGGGYAPVAVLN